MSEEFHFFDNCPICQDLKKKGIKPVWFPDEPAAEEKNDLEHEGFSEIAVIPEEQAPICFTEKDILQTELFLDAAMFLKFVKEHKPKLTPAGNLTRKDIYLLNQQLQNPDQLDKKFISKVHKLRSEPEAKTLHFLRILCQLGKLIKKYRSHWIISSQGEKLLANPKELYYRLWQRYLFHLNWLYFVFALDEKKIEFLQSNFDQIALFLLAKEGRWVLAQNFLFEFFPDNKEIFYKLKNKKGKTDKEKCQLLDIELAQIPVQQILFDKLEYFGIIKTKKKMGRFQEYSEITHLQLTLLGKKVLEGMFRF